MSCVLHWFLIAASLISAITVIWFAGFSRELQEVWIYFLALLPPIFSVTTSALLRTSGRLFIWSLRFWFVFLLMVGLALMAWHTDAWAPVMWVTAAEVWLGGSLLTLATAIIVRLVQRRKTRANKALHATAAAPGS